MYLQQCVILFYAVFIFNEKHSSTLVPKNYSSLLLNPLASIGYQNSSTSKNFLFGESVSVSVDDTNSELIHRKWRGKTVTKAMKICLFYTDCILGGDYDF